MRQQSLEFNFDREAYLEALTRVPVFTRESIEETINLLCKMAQVIGEMGLNKLRLTETNKELLAANAQLQREISERQEAERSGRESEERYRTLFNTSRDAMVIMIPGEHFIDANPAALELFGCRDIDEFTQNTPADLSPVYQPDGVLTTDKVREVRDLTLAKGSHFFEWKHLRPNGEVFYATVLLTRMQLKDQTVLQGTIRDVTASKQAEEELKKYREHLEELVRERTAELDQANQRLQQDLRRREAAEDKLRMANRELEAFAYTVSHDLRTPLTPIIGYAHFLRECYQDRLDSQALTCLDEISEAGEKMVDLMEDLLTLARVGHVQRPAEPLDTGAIIHEVVSELSAKIAQTEVAVVVDSPPTLRIPKTFLTQIFDNLIGNAIRYAGQKDSPIEIGGERKEDLVLFYVRDHGPGIPEQERDRIFEAFYRGASSQKFPGTGVGLATVLKIARLYGGNVWVEETPGGGSTFWVEMVDVPTAAENEENSF
ncbi:MAG: ATP-binding protein [Desulfuromonadaceae bacterium]